MASNSIKKNSESELLLIELPVKRWNGVNCAEHPACWHHVDRATVPVKRWHGVNCAEHAACWHHVVGLLTVTPHLEKNNFWSRKDFLFNVLFWPDCEVSYQLFVNVFLSTLIWRRIPIQSAFNILSRIRIRSKKEQLRSATLVLAGCRDSKLWSCRAESSIRNQIGSV